MSMISAQIDRLRGLATRYDELQVGAVKAVTMPSDMGSILRDAADTIWQLRDDLQRTHGLLGDAEHDESRAWDRVREAEAEADRLRELVSFIMHQCNDGNPWCDECIGWNDGECVALLHMRKLGVEVDA